MPKNSKRRRPGPASRRLVVESLESRELLTAVAAVQVSDSPVESLDIVFTGPVQIDSGSLAHAMELASIDRGPVDLSAGEFAYHEATNTLAWSFGRALQRGIYELRLDVSQLQDTSGAPLDGGIGGLHYQLPVFAAGENVSANGAEIEVGSFSVPSLVDWNSDGLLDLVVGQKTDLGEGKIGVYLNSGTAETPAFGVFSYAQQEGADLVVVSQGCLGVYPRVFDWDGDTKKDLILGLSDGRVQVFPNVGSDTEPRFGAPSDVMVGQPGNKAAISVGMRATFEIVDWNNDGRYDLIAGGFDGRLRVYANVADVGPADFRSEKFVHDGPDELVVSELRASVAVADLDGDGRKDLALGDTAGQVLFYRNVGTDANPAFDGWERISAANQAIDLPDMPRSRPFVGDLNADAIPDLLVGSKDGLVRLYAGVSWETPTTESGVTNPASAEYLYTFEVLPPAWQNTVNRFDVNDDTYVSPLDVLLIINELHRQYTTEFGRIPSAPSPASPPPFLDVSGDGYCGPGDVLQLINYLIGRSEGAEGGAPHFTQTMDRSSPRAESSASIEDQRWDAEQIDFAATVQRDQQTARVSRRPEMDTFSASLDELITGLAQDITTYPLP